MSKDKERWMMQFKHNDLTFVRTFDFDSTEQRDEYIDMCKQTKGWDLDELWRSERIVNETYANTPRGMHSSWERDLGWE